MNEMSPQTDSLAILGSAPAFQKELHVGRPNHGDRSRLFERIGEILDRNWLANCGPMVTELEARIAKLTGVEHCVAVSSGTTALELVIRAANLHGEVIVPSLTFVATPHALSWQGIQPVFCEIDPCTHNIDPSRIEALITPRTTGIVGVHLWGRPCDVDALEQIANRNGLALILDAAHALACSHRGQMIGNRGSAEVFSLHATKFINSFEGGVVTTNDREIAGKVRETRTFGFQAAEQVVSTGTNAKMHEVSAAMGLTLLDSIDSIVETNESNYDEYIRQLRDIEGLSVLPFDRQEKCNFQYVVIEVDAARSRLTRDELLDVLHAENVLARRLFFPGCHRLQPYRNETSVLPVTDDVCRRVLQLPTGTNINRDDIKQIVDIIRNALAASDEVRGAIARRGPRFNDFESL